MMTTLHATLRWCGLAACAAALMGAPGAFAATDAVKPYDQFSKEIRAAVAPMAGKEIVGFKTIFLNRDVGPWLDTGMDLEWGDQVTLVLNGKLVWSHALNLSWPAPLAVWSRIGEEGPIFRGARDTNTFMAEKSGPLQLKLYPGERWLTPEGEYAGAPAPVNLDVDGGLNVALIKWRPRSDVQGLLKQIAKTDPKATWAADEVDRQNNQKNPPPGWNYIWELYASEIFTEVKAPKGANAPARAILLHMNNDGNIMETHAPFDLTPETTLKWKWRADKLPSQVSENSIPTHDYMSIAVKFDNGKDLTFMWSHDMEVDHHFECPLPGWTHRETHVVARSGKADMGKWLSEEKNILDYYAKAIGGEPPKRVTQVWLIAVSVFQKTEGISQFGDIVLEDGKNTLKVF